MVNQLSAHRDFNSLNCIQNQYPQFAVKATAIPHNFQRSAFLELIGAFLAKGEEVSGQPIVTDYGQPLYQYIPVCVKPAFNEKISLLIKAEGLLKVFHQDFSSHKKPPGLRFRGEARGAC